MGFVTSEKDRIVTKSRKRECDNCGAKWLVTYQPSKHPNWNPPFKCMSCGCVGETKPHFE